MILKISCENCGCEDLQEMDSYFDFYCPSCDDEVHITECDIEVLEVVEVTT